MPRIFDIAVLGGTPAGYVAARYLAKNNCDVIVLDGVREPVEGALADWVAPEFFQLPGLPRFLAKHCQAEPFKRVCYHNADLTRQVEYVARKPAGYFLHTKRLVESLRAAAGQAGATIRRAKKRPAILLAEDLVHLTTSRQTRAKLLLIVQDRPRDVIRDLALPARTVPTAELVVAGLDVPVSSARAHQPLRGALHVVESPERTELGLFFLTRCTLHLRIVSSSPAAGTRGAELSQMVAGLQGRGMLPSRLALGRAAGGVWYPPAGVALELETHVAKRCLLAGTAGGFADTITGQTLYPSVRSALAAADAALAALNSNHPQETLMGYKTSWRSSLADYLRPPNTSLQMLLPLLFANKRIVPRFTRALLYGQSI